MSLSRVRSSVGLSPWRRTLLVLVGIPALLLGLMAMHALSSESAVAAESPAVAVAQESAVPEGAAVASGETLHDVATLACVLALAAGLFLALPVLGSRLGQLVRRAALPLPLARGGLPWPRVCLDLLSSSRS